MSERMTPALREALHLVSARLRDPMLDIHPASLGAEVVRAFPKGARTGDVLKQLRMALGMTAAIGTVFAWARHKRREELASIIETLIQAE